MQLITTFFCRENCLLNRESVKAGQALIDNTIKVCDKGKVTPKDHQFF